MRIHDELREGVRENDGRDSDASAGIVIEGYQSQKRAFSGGVTRRVTGQPNTTSVRQRESKVAFSDL